MDPRLCQCGLKISFIVLVVLIMVIIVFLANGPYKVSTVTQSSHFTVVLDCGSTGTRISVYEWLINNTNDQVLPTMLQSLPVPSSRAAPQRDICQYHCMQTEPGLDKFVGNFSGIISALEPLLLWAEHQIPLDKHAKTPAFVLATAGLRRLPVEDAGWVLKCAESILKKHHFIYRSSWIRVLRGKEESYYGWVALNYKMKRLKHPSTESTLGVLDLGGSSLQVVMEVKETREGEHFLTSKIGSIEHQLLAYSLPALGLNAAFERSILMLSKQKSLRVRKNGTLELRHPCLNSGFNQNYTCYGCHFMPSGTDWQNPIGQHMNNESTLLHLVGDPNWQECKEVAKATSIYSNSSDWLQFMNDFNCKVPPLIGTDLLNQTTFSYMVSRFRALSGFFAVYSTLNLNPKVNLTELLVRGEELCSRPWEDLGDIYKTRHYAEQSCFRMPYLAYLLEDALCLGDVEIMFGPGDVSWTLGAALVEDQHLWLGKSEDLADHFAIRMVEVISSPVLLFLLFFCLISILYMVKVKHNVAVLGPMAGKRGAANLSISLPSYIRSKRQLN
ncbi:probable apyrase 7 [Aristolochia californica]|uniref:probable apyrase 7 n=1 Tax=Aristolochia californica TaxID=171875 RepID=UPI0035D579DB